MDQHIHPPEESAPKASPDSPASAVPADRTFHVNSFIIEDSFYRSRLPRATHWSVAWSDLMMTMFILFLSMFVYQAAHEDFLVSNTPEILGGSTTEAIDLEFDQDLIVPIVPLSQTAPLISAGTIKMVEKVRLDEIDIDQAFQEEITSPAPTPTIKKEDLVHVSPEAATISEATRIQKHPLQVIDRDDIPALSPPPPSVTTPPETKTGDSFNEIYGLSMQVLDKHQLDKFASIEVIPDKTMRIILTGDLLFSIGKADLSMQARESLQKITAVIQHTPYMINVIGHTDNTPMHSAKFTSNWELSVVRASSVARFLMTDMKMNPQQFIVSGYGAQRPRKSNNNASSRAINRRVEIILSKRLPPAVAVTPTNLL